MILERPGIPKENRSTNGRPFLEWKWKLLLLGMLGHHLLGKHLSLLSNALMKSAVNSSHPFIDSSIFNTSDFKRNQWIQTRNFIQAAKGPVTP